MKQIAPNIGIKITAAALPPNPNFPLLLEKTCLKDLTAQFGMSDADARKFLKSSEKQFRQLMVLYGQVLMQDDTTAVILISDQLADIATALLAANGITLPPGVDITLLIQFGIMQSMMLCAPNFSAEVFATFNFVDSSLPHTG